MRATKTQLELLREHVKAESAQDMDTLLDGMTADCFNDVVCVSRPFIGPARVAERYRKHWQGFPDFKVRVRRFLSIDRNCIVTENEWSGTHRGTFLGIRPTGKKVKVRALVAWHFRGKKLWGETVFFDMGSILKQIGGRIVVPRKKAVGSKEGQVRTAGRSASNGAGRPRKVGRARGATAARAGRPEAAPTP